MKPNLIGNPAPNLVLWDTLGTEINLRDIDAKYTVLYFYDPDCGHCKTKTPILYASYPELQAKGVEILAVCTTTDERRWLEFIRENDLGWINIADLQAKTYFKFYYDVRSTPTVYILDKDKKILAKKIDVEQVEAVIDALIAQGE
jgi:peroxiredoxin